MSAAGLLLALGLAAAPPPPTLTIVVPEPATGLSKLEPFLGWAGGVLPSARPRQIKEAVAPLGLDPFAASPEAWRSAGLDPTAPAYLWVPGRGVARASVGLAAAAQLREHLSARARTTPAKRGWGFVAGRAGRPSLIGSVSKERVWLQRHRALFPVKPPDRPAYARAKVEKLAAGVEGFETPRRGRLAKFGRPKRAPDGWLHGRGPAPVEAWVGGVWVEPERFVGAAHLDLAGLAAPYVADWVGSGRPRRLLAVPETAVAEVVTRAQPSALAGRLVGAPPGAARLFSGGAHATLTARGSLVAALELRAGTTVARAETLAKGLAKRAPGLRWAVRTRPRRLVLWYPGADGAEVETWTQARPEGRATAPTWARVRPRGLLRAIRARDAAPAGPALGTGRGTILGMMYGRFLTRTGVLTAGIRKGRQGLDVWASILR